MERDSIIFYSSFYKAASEMNAKERLALYDAILMYAFDGVEPEITNKQVKMAFILSRPQIDANNERYINGKKGAEHGQKGGRPKKQKTPMGLSEKTPMGLLSKTPNVNDNVNVNENVNVNVNENDYSAELKKHSSTQPIIALPLNTGEEYPIDTEQAEEWAGLYPAVDVIQQLRAMRGWLNANPAKRKTKNGILRFVNTWLSKEQDRGGNTLQRRQNGNVFAELVKDGVFDE
nr:MAG TPA: hypothetical protein [Caudoviricetes sp.]